MTPEQFCYWLTGYFEMSESDTLSANQIQMIKNHLDLVIVKVTPPLSQGGAAMPLTTEPPKMRNLPHPLTCGIGFEANPINEVNICGSKPPYRPTTSSKPIRYC